MAMRLCIRSLYPAWWLCSLRLQFCGSKSKIQWDSFTLLLNPGPQEFKLFYSQKTSLLVSEQTDTTHYCMLQMLNIYEHFRSVYPGLYRQYFSLWLLPDIFSIWPVKWLKRCKSLLQSIFHCWFTARSVVVGLIFTEWIREKVIVNSSAERGKQTANWLEIFSGTERLQLAWISCGTSASMETKKD